MSELRLSPWVAWVSSESETGEVQRGAYHRLTGQSHGLSEPLHELLRLLRTTALSSDDVRELKACGAEAILDRLREAHFVVTTTDPAELLAPFLDHVLTRPRLNPAVFCRPSDAAPHVVRLARSDSCSLPRTAAVPRLVDEILPPQAAELLSAAASEHTLRVALSGTHGTLEALDYLTRPERQLVRLRRNGRSAEVPDIGSECLNQSFHRSGDIEAAPEYYLSGIEEAAWNFDWVEPTVNHSFRYATEALGGQDYGGRFCDAAIALQEREGPLASDVLEILEIGGGTGSFARSFIERAIATGSNRKLRYTILDQSPVLLRAQAELLSGVGAEVRFVQGDARELELNGARFNLVVCNEMIADLPVAEREGGAVQTGALAMVERLRHCMFPGGVAILTEYGDEHAPSQLVRHLNHAEYSIQFAPLSEHASNCGLKAELVNLADLLAVNPHVEMLIGQQEHVLCLDRAMNQLGLRVPYAAFTRRGFEARYGEALKRLGILGLAYAPMAHGLHFGPDLRQFRALILSHRA